MISIGITKMLHRKIRTTSSGRSFVRYLSGQDRSWNPGSPALQFENDDVMTVDRMVRGFYENAASLDLTLTRIPLRNP